jgi:DNA invertase Pin-like site-specific DNA recombinase
MTKENAGIRAIAYVRVSTSRQADDGNSISTQVTKIRAYAKMRGLKLLSRDIVIDDGVSGGIPLWDRHGGGLLLDRLESGKYQHIIAVKLDRLFRLVSDTLETIDYLHSEDIGVHIIDLKGQALDTSSSMGRFFITMMAALAEMERGLISERTQEGMAYLKDNHLQFTRVIYGWNAKADGSIVPNWKEQELIDYMWWQMAKNGMSATSVARSMNKKGHTGKLGGKWTASNVLRAVRNDYHKERTSFGYPKGWGSKPWHRGRTRSKNGQRDERIDKPPPVEVWDKDDLA